MTGVGGVGGVGGGKWKQLYLNNKKMDQLDQWKKKKNFGSSPCQILYSVQKI